MSVSQGVDIIEIYRTVCRDTTAYAHRPHAFANLVSSLRVY